MTEDMNLPAADEFEGPEELLPEANLANEMPDFDDGDDDDMFEGVDPATILTIRPSTGDAQYLVLEEPIPFSTALMRAGLTFNGQIDIFCEGTQISYDDLVSGGQTVTVIGNVKGGIG